MSRQGMLVVKERAISSGIYGATRQDRTGDLLITNQPLYQLS
jgi:hypothetical protein